MHDLCGTCALLCCAASRALLAVRKEGGRGGGGCEGAAADAGVQVTSADRTTGLITGNKAGAAVTIKLQTQADSRVSVTFDAPNAKESNPTLSSRWLAAYQRRMGR